MKVKIEGMSCNGCTSRVEKALKGFSELSDVVVDLGKKEATFNGVIEEARVKQAIEDLGFDVVEITK